MFKRNYGTLGYKIAKLRIFRSTKMNPFLCFLVCWFMALLGAVMMLINENILCTCIFIAYAAFLLVEFSCEALYQDMLDLREKILLNYQNDMFQKVFYIGDESIILNELADQYSIYCGDIKNVEYYATLEESNDALTAFIVLRAEISYYNKKTVSYETDLEFPEFFNSFTLENSKETSGEKIEPFKKAI